VGGLWTWHAGWSKVIITASVKLRVVDLMPCPVQPAANNISYPLAKNCRQIIVGNVALNYWLISDVAFLTRGEPRFLPHPVVYEMNSLLLHNHCQLITCSSDYKSKQLAN